MTWVKLQLDQNYNEKDSKSCGENNAHMTIEN